MSFIPVRYIRKTKTIACYYFLLLATINIGATIANGTPGIAEVIILIVAILPLIIKNQKFHLFFGAFALALWTFLIWTVSFDLVDYLKGEKYSHPMLYFGLGYLLTIISAAVSVLIIYMARLPLPKKAEIFR